MGLRICCKGSFELKVPSPTWPLFEKIDLQEKNGGQLSMSRSLKRIIFVGTVSVLDCAG